ncbi:MAG: SCP2 sterol-binding domain-containing protein [Pseudomonadota bacterium]
MKLPAPLAMAITAGFNQYLALDSEAAPKLERLYGKLINIELTAVNIGFYLLFHRDRIEVLEAFDGPADVTIRGAPFSMISLANGHSELASAGVTIEGDVELAERFSRVMRQVDIDWEEHLSRLTGDAVAHQLGNVARGIAGFVDRTRLRMQSNTADYLRDETGQLPYDWEVEDFCNEVDDLRDRVEALAARISSR